MCYVEVFWKIEILFVYCGSIIIYQKVIWQNIPFSVTWIKY